MSINLSLPTDVIWAVEPVQFQAVLNSMQRIDSSKYAIASGPVDDAERERLPIKKIGAVAIIQVKGIMIQEESFLTEYYDFVSTDSIRRAVESARKDPEITTVLFIVKSLGGSVGGLAELGDAVYNLRNEKIVIVQVNGVMASAALYFGSQSHEIHAGRMDMIGSIGTRLMLYDFSKLYEDAGIKAIPIDTGEFKSASAEGTVITDNQIADFQRIVEGYFEDFMNILERGLNMSRPEISAIADGRMFFSQQALELGLIKSISSVDETINRVLSENPVQNNTNIAQNKLKMAGLHSLNR